MWPLWSRSKLPLTKTFRGTGFLLGMATVTALLSLVNSRSATGRLRREVSTPHPRPLSHASGERGENTTFILLLDSNLLSPQRPQRKYIKRLERKAHLKL